jgi:hypothetical protein
MNVYVSMGVTPPLSKPAKPALTKPKPSSKPKSQI